MARNTPNDWDSDPDQNEDIGGISIRNIDPVSDGAGAVRESMAQWADVVNGTTPIKDTWTFADPSDLTKRVRIKATNVTPGNVRDIIMPDEDVALHATAHLPWLAVPVGGYVFCDPEDGAIPPTDHPDYRYVLCTAGEDGSGDYNEGILTGESITGSGATLVATAVVDLDGSPYDGVAIHLINTEGRTIYAGESAGVHWNDQMQQITAFLTGVWASSGGSDGAISHTNVSGVRGNASSGVVMEIIFDSSDSPGARTGDRTRAKGITMVAYRRIK